MQRKGAEGEGGGDQGAGASAALFFGSLLPLALTQQSGFPLPGVCGIATAVPVLVFAVRLSVGANKVGRACKRLVVVEKWARGATGVLLVVVGIDYCLVHILGLI